jgi:hypothetical protein
MYNTENLIGDVVTIKVSSGIEILATLIGVDEEFRYLTVTHPRNLVINSDSGELALVPYVFTSSADEIVMNTSEILSVSLTAEESKEDYLNLVEKDEPSDEVIVSEHIVEEKSDK